MFSHFPQVPLDPIFQLQADFLADINPNKVNLGIGLYADQNGNPVVLKSIKQAFNQVDTSDFNYQPIGGNKNFLQKTAELIFQISSFDNLAMQATAGGTQAIRMFADLCFQENPNTVMLIAIPTWGNHLAICKNLSIQTFSHLNDQGLASLESYKNALEQTIDGSAIIFHGGKTHNPSGQNLSLSEFLSLADIINQKNIKVFIDSAYFGFGDSFNDEANFLTQLYNAYNNFAVGFSFSKNASLYEHRTGALFIKTNSKQAVESQMQQLARESISMAPGLGQEIMLTILSDQNLTQQWEQEVDQIRQTLNQRRSDLVENLPSKFTYLNNAAGMFGLLPFTPDKIAQIKSDYSIYFPSNGRINIAGINSNNLDYLIQAFKKF